MRYLTKIRISKPRKGEGKEEKRTTEVARDMEGLGQRSRGRQEAGKGTSQRQMQKGACAVWKAKEGRF